MPKTNRFTKLDDYEVEVLCMALDVYLASKAAPGHKATGRELLEELENSIA